MTTVIIVLNKILIKINCKYGFRNNQYTVMKIIYYNILINYLYHSSLSKYNIKKNFFGFIFYRSIIDSIL